MTTTRSAAPDVLTPDHPSVSTAEQSGGERSSTRLLVGGGLVAALVGAGVGLGQALYVAVAVVGIIVVVTSFTSDRGLLHLLVLVPFGESLSVGPLTVGRIMAVLIVAVLGLKLLTGRLTVPSFPPVTWLPAGAMVLVVVASGLWAASFDGWLFALGQVALAVAFFAAFALLVRGPSDVTGLLRTYVAAAVVAAGIALVQALADLRAEGLQGDPNIFALYQVAALPVAVALARSTSGWRRAGWSVTVIPILVSVIASQSRGALLALVATALCLAVLHERRRILVPLIAVVGLLLTYAAPLVDDRYGVERISSDRASGRIDIWFTAWQAFLDQPWTGIGAGSFVPQSIDRLTTEPGVELIKSHLLTGKGIEVHNIYLEALAERGVFGLLTLLAFLAATAWCLWMAARRHRTLAVKALLPMFLAFCVAAVFLSVLNSKLLWMLAGLAAALVVVPTDRDRTPVHPDTASRSLR